MDINEIQHRNDIPADVREYILTLAAEWEQLKDEHRQILHSAPVCLTVIDKETIRALEDAVEGMARCDTKGNILYTNEIFANMFGYKSSKELNNLFWQDLIFPDDLSHMQNKFQQMHEKGNVTTEARGARKDGSDFHFKITLISTFDKNDKFAGHYCFIHDITHHIKTINALEISRERFNLAVDSAHIGIWDWFVFDDTLTWNKYMHQIFDHPIEAFQGNNNDFIERVHPKDRKRISQEIQLAINGQKYYETTYRVIWRNKTIHHIFAMGKVYYDEKDKLIRMTGICQDITKRIQIELDLKASEEHNRLILNSAGEGIYGLDIEGNLTFANPASEQLLGYTAKELIGKPMHALIHHSYEDGTPYPRDKCPVCESFNEGKTNHVNNEVLWRKDGSCFSVEYTSTPIKKEGCLVGAVVTFSDNTIRKQVEDELEKNAQEINLLFHGTQIANESGSLEEAMQRCLDLICESLQWPIGHAYIPDEKNHKLLLPSGIWHIDDPERTNKFREITEMTTFENGIGLPGRIYVSGKPEWIEDVYQDDNFPRAKVCNDLNVHAAVGFPVFVNNQIVAVLEFFSHRIKKRDENLLHILQILSEQLGRVLERRIATEAIKQAEEQNRLVLESVVEGIYGVDMNGLTTFVNPAAEEMLGYHANELIGQLMHSLIHHSYPDGAPYPFEKCPMYAAFTDGKVYHINDEVLWRKDSSSFPVEYTSTPIRKKDQLVGAVITFRDITERQQAENKLMVQHKALENKALELSTMNNKLQESNQDLDQFAYITSHDLKAPLRGISNLATWLEEDLGENITEESLKHIQLLKTRVKRMNALIEGILDYSRVGRIQTEISSVDMQSMMNEIIDQLEKPESFNIQITSKLPVLNAPLIPLTQVFTNLINNGIKYHNRPDGNIFIDAEEDDNFYKFSVTDDGPGISPEYHDKIFSIFQTLNTDSHIESTGIGLTIVKKIIEWQGGKINIESNVDKGTAFHFTWPKQPMQDS